MRRGGLARLLATTSLACVASDAALAEVATDGTLGRRARLTGRDVEVGAELGRISGKNLFHSFERFGVQAGGSVTFTGPGGLDNVVSRVTGGEVSRIDGTLRSRVPGADVYLVNPSGIVFGSGGRLDVPGSFHASTADEVRFADGARFSAIDPSGSTLSVAAPEAFGFLGARPGAITVDRGVLEVPRGERLSLVGGDIAVTAGVTDLDAPEPTAGIVRAEAGTVTLSALGGAGEAAIGSGQVAGDATGVVLVTGRALVESTGDGGGSVRISGGRLRVEGRSFVFADNAGPTDAVGGVTVAAGSIEVVDRSAVTADATGGGGKAGRVTITAGQLLVAGRAFIKSDSVSTGGDAGSVAIWADEIEVSDGSSIRSSTFAAGDAGMVAIAAERLLVSGARVVSSAEEGSAGRAGTVRVRVEELELRGQGQIASSTFAVGDAGAVEVEAGRLLVTGVPDSEILTGITSQANRGSSGDAGTVRVRAGELELRDGGAISSGTFSAGDAGKVEVEVGRLLVIGVPDSEFATGIASQAEEGSSGDAGAVMIRAQEIELRDAARIRSGTAAEGNAGTVVIWAEEITLSSRADISSSTFGAGDAGAVTVEAGRLRITGANGFFTGITSQANQGSNGNAGSVRVRARELEIFDGGQITSSTLARGDAGLVKVEAGRLVIDGFFAINTLTGIASNADRGSSGNAGAVRVRAEEIEARFSGEISSISFASGNAGDVEVRASRLMLRDGGLIASRGLGTGPAGSIRLIGGALLVNHAGILTDGTGNTGGRIDITASDVIALRRGEIISDGIVPATDTSLITLRAPQIALLDGSRVTSLTGDGDPLPGSGEARIDGGFTFISDDSRVRGSSSVELEGVENEVGTGLDISPVAFLDAERLMGQSCAARAAGQASTFSRAGKGGLPPAPDRPLSSGGASRAGLLRAGGELRVASTNCTGERG